MEAQCTIYSCPFCDEVDDSYDRIIKQMLMRHPYLSEKLIKAFEETKQTGKPVKCEFCDSNEGRKSHWHSKWENGTPRQYIMCKNCEEGLDEASISVETKLRINKK